MAKKIKKPSKEIEDPNLEEVDENRAFEIEADEETNEVVFVHHYRRKWGDNFNADVEHGLNIEEATDMIGVVINILDHFKSKILMEKVIPEVKEGNPLQGPNNLDGR